MNKTLLLRRIWYHYPYVISADVLSADPTHEDDLSSLRDDASCDGHCYVKFTRSFGDGTYLARVAASPALLRHQGYTVVFNEAQLAKAIPWHDQLMKSA
ncbi:MAG TPA: hypothetical protein VF844_07485 [Ktedonobacteraceae bacterium]